MNKFILNSMLTLGIIFGTNLNAKNMIYDYIKEVNRDDFLATQNYEDFNNRSKIKQLNSKYRFEPIDKKVKIIETEINKYFRTEKYEGLVKSLAKKSISKDNSYIKNIIIYDILKECCYEDINLVSVPHNRLVYRKNRYYDSSLNKWLSRDKIVQKYGLKPEVMNKKDIFFNAIYEKIETENKTYDKEYENKLKYIIKKDPKLYEAKFSLANMHLINGNCKKYNKVFEEYSKSVKGFSNRRNKLKCINKTWDIVNNDNGEVLKKLNKNYDNKTNTEIYLNNKIIIEVKKFSARYKHIKYKLGSKDASLGTLDCSGFVSQILNKVNLNISPKYSNTITLDNILSKSNSEKVYDYKNKNNESNLKNGDILIFYFDKYDRKNKIPFHTGIYSDYKHKKGIIHVVTRKGLTHEKMNKFYLNNLKYGYRIKVKNNISKIKKNIILKKVKDEFCDKVTYRSIKKRFCK